MTKSCDARSRAHGLGAKRSGKTVLSDLSVVTASPPVKAYAVAFVLVASILGAAEPSHDEVLATDRNVQGLTTIQMFSLANSSPWGSVGLPAGEVYLKRILREKEPLPFLRAAYNTGSPAGKLYALAGIRSVAPELFDVCVKDIRESGYNPTITYRRGCLGGEASFQLFMMEIAIGLYDGYLHEQLGAPAR